MSNGSTTKRVAAVIASLPSPLRAETRRLFRGKRRGRYGADLSRAEKMCLLRLRRHGVPFRPLEPIGHLADNSGNNAQRATRDASRMLRRLRAMASRR
jgi:hypothetical protein